MHGNDSLRLDEMHQLSSLLSIDCVMSSYRDQADIKVFQLPDLPFLKFTPQVTEVRNASIPIIYDVDRIRPAFCALHFIMEGVYHCNGEGTCFPFCYLYQILRVMVAVIMAAKNHICGLPEWLQTRYISILIGIQYERVAVALILESCVSYPCYLHIVPPFPADPGGSQDAILTAFSLTA